MEKITKKSERFPLRIFVEPLSPMVLVTTDEDEKFIETKFSSAFREYKHIKRLLYNGDMDEDEFAEKADMPFLNIPRLLDNRMAVRLTVACGKQKANIRVYPVGIEDVTTAVLLQDFCKQANAMLQRAES